MKGIKQYVADVQRTHHTGNYHSDGLIVRRGFPVRLGSPGDEVKLVLDLIPVHEKNREELGPEFELTPGSEVDGWKLEASDDGLTLHVPPNAIVGVYAVSLGEEKGAMTVLFNPWCEDDECYMEDEDQRNEYVLNDNGRIWVGSAKSLSGRPWLFAQFKTKSLLAVMDLLDRMPWEDRRSVVKVTRHLTAIVNSSDDRGMLTGNWSGDYSGGTSPLAWTGSAEIMAKFWDTQQPVQYGQCWVFSGVMTSCMRALGIASRSVTNFNSAHDSTKPYNRAVDKYYTADGEPQPEKSADSIWNFHVWNEAWMTRPDLKDKEEEHNMSFAGWQAVDATPQEESEGIYQMGPAPITAIKNGIAVDYDVDFVIGEVNADILHHWHDEGSGKYRLRQKNQRHVGQNVSTKQVGADDREDVTGHYKYPEGSEEERNALAGRPNATEEPEHDNPDDEDVEFTIEATPDVQTGETIVLEIHAKNTGSETTRSVHLTSLARAVDYTGRPRGIIDTKKDDVEIDPGETKTLKIEITPEEYKRYLSSGLPAIQFQNAGKVADTEQSWSYIETIRFNSDEMLKVDCPPTAELGKTLDVQAVIRNGTAFPLTNVKLRVEGQGLAKLTVVELSAIHANTTVRINMKIRPVEVGDRLLITTLDTDELKDLVRSVHVQVADSEDGRETVSYVRDRYSGRMEVLLGNLANLRI